MINWITIIERQFMIYLLFLPQISTLEILRWLLLEIRLLQWSELQVNWWIYFVLFSSNPSIHVLEVPNNRLFKGSNIDLYRGYNIALHYADRVNEIDLFSHVMSLNIISMSLLILNFRIQFPHLISIKF